MTKTVKNAADTFARVDKYLKVIARRDRSLKECLHWINFTEKLTEDIARHQGQTPPSRSQYDLKLSKDRKLGKEQLPETGERLERLTAYMKLIASMQKMHQDALVRFNDTVRIPVESNQPETVPALPDENVGALCAEERIAFRYFIGHKKFCDMYGLEIPGLNEAPKSLDVEEKKEDS